MDTEAATPPAQMPFSIPSDQAYYWSFTWQGDIREAMEAIRRGDFEDFDTDDPNDAVRWLLNND